MQTKNYPEDSVLRRHHESAMKFAQEAAAGAQETVEAKAAELLQAIQEGESQAMLAASYEQLQRDLSNLNISSQPTPGSISADNNDGNGNTNNRPGAASRSATSSGDIRNSQPQFTYAGRNVNAELRHVISVLQSRIQDAILLTARMDADEPVPPKYRALVDEYYKALSDDLR